MEQAENQKIEERKIKAKNWLRNKNNLLVLAVLLFAVSIRFYYFLLTKTQPLWWDELAYGSLAKNQVYHLWDSYGFIQHETLIRPPAFPFLWSLLVRVGFGEVGSRFILEFLPSILSVFFVYMAGKELYNRKVGIIASAIFSVLWVHLFYTLRFLTDIPTLPFLFLSIYYFIKSQKTDFNSKYFGISLFLLTLATAIRYPVGIVFLAYLITLIATRKFYLLKNPKFWKSGILGISPILLFFVYNLITAGNIFPALFGGTYLRPGEEAGKPIAWNVLNLIPIYLKTPFFILFLIGLAIMLFELVLGFDVINKKTRLQSHLVVILTIALILSFFIFFTRAAEDRWLLQTSLSMAIIAALGLDYVHNIVKKYSKLVAFLGVAGILLFGGYQQFVHADQLIKNKMGSYLQIRQGFEWVRDNLPKGTVILGEGLDPYAIYYAEWQTAQLPKEMSEIDESKVDYLVFHAFVEHPAYFGEYLQSNQDKWRPINAFFFDAQQTQPGFIIYQKVS